jgi:hypothetical protein
MSNATLTGNDMIQINDRIISDLADGDCLKISFPDAIAQMKVAKNGNALYAENKPGYKGIVELRLCLASDDDKWLNSLMSKQQADFSNFDLMTLSFSKRVKNAEGRSSAKVYQATGGFFQKMVETKTTAEGDVEQSVAVYTMEFVFPVPAIQ